MIKAMMSCLSRPNSGFNLASRMKISIDLYGQYTPFLEILHSRPECNHTFVTVQKLFMYARRGTPKASVA